MCARSARIESTSTRGRIICRGEYCARSDMVDAIRRLTDDAYRHVRVHHVDKDRDDPELWEVLAKRSEGSGKARRRRNTGAST